MKLLCAFILLSFTCQAQTVTGKWITVDDNTGQEKSVVEISERDGKVFGKVIRIFPRPEKDPDPVCSKCPADDSRYNKKVIGMEILQNMKKSGNEYTDGTILDPEVGKIYKCKIWREGDNLKVRGYWGPFYRTQTWKPYN
jgi:uncharacterized protein (DUF2147 family)